MLFLMALAVTAAPVDDELTRESRSIFKKKDKVTPFPPVVLVGMVEQFIPTPVAVPQQPPSPQQPAPVSSYPAPYYNPHAVPVPQQQWVGPAAPEIPQQVLDPIGSNELHAEDSNKAANDVNQEAAPQ